MGLDLGMDPADPGSESEEVAAEDSFLDDAFDALTAAKPDREAFKEALKAAIYSCMQDEESGESDTTGEA